MRVDYKVYVNGVEFHPYITNDLSLEEKKQEGQEYYRTELTGKLKFVGSEFDDLESQAFDARFDVLIETYKNYVHDSSEDWNGKFYKADGSWDYDNKVLEVTVQVQDQYTDFLSKYDKEFDLVKMGTARTPLSTDSRPLIQMYRPDDTVVSCFLGGTYWEQQVSTPTSLGDLSGFEFSLLSTSKRMTLTDPIGTSTPSELLGTYTESTGTSLDNPETWIFVKDDGLPYEIRVARQGQVPPDPFYEYRYEIYRTTDDLLLFSSAWKSNSPQQSPTFSPENTPATGIFIGSTETQFVYARWVLNKTTLNGQATTAILDDDFIADNRNYQYAISFDDALPDTESPIKANGLGSITPTQYGLKPDGEYFTPPITAGVKYYPVAKNNWGNVSLWFFFTTDILNTEVDGRQAYITNDSMLISDAISRVLQEMNVGVTHQATTSYSVFLYDLINPIDSNSLARMIIAPKSNITKGSYDQPATKSPITMKMILDMFYTAFNLFWYIDSSNRLIIEHQNWFKNGGSYSTSPAIGYDLTTLINSRNKKPYAYNSSKVEYEKQSLPERITFAWSDDVTDVFEGSGIEVISGYVLDGLEEENQVNNFSSDIDFIRLNPDSISDDGYVLFYAELLVSGDYVLPYEDLEFDGATSSVQNAWASFVWGLDKYWRYNAPASQLVINGNSTTALTTRSAKKQNVSFPSLDRVDPLKLIKTYVGNGRVGNNTLNLSSRNNTIKLTYDVE